MSAQKVWNGSEWETIGAARPDGGGEGGGIPHPPNDTPDPYVRPADWTTMPTVNVGDQKVCVLVAVWDHNSNFVAVSCAGPYTVDWGDGTASENFASDVQANHVYAYSAVGSLSSRGYRQAIMTITPQAGQSLTAVDLSRKHVQAGLPSDATWKHPWLEIRMAGSLINNLALSAGASGRWPVLLERFEYLGPSSIVNGTNLFYGSSSLQEMVGTNWTAGITNFTSFLASCGELQTVPRFETQSGNNFQAMFTSCILLKSLPTFDTAAGTAFNSMFIGCRLLRSAPPLVTTNGTQFNGMFSGCTALETVPLLDTAKGTNFYQTFYNCASLREVPLLDTHLGTDFTSCFSGCSSLEVVPLLNTSAAINLSSAFANCQALRGVPLFNTSKATNVTQMFSGCSRLASIPAFDMRLATSLSLTFGNCSSLREAPSIDTRSCTTFTSAFLNCTSLRSVALFDTSKGTVFSNMFSGCYALRDVPLFDMSKGTTFTGMFQNCTVLMRLPDFVFGAATNTSTMLSGCGNLRIVPRLSFTLVTLATNAFSGTGMLSRSLVTGTKVSVGYNISCLGPAELDEIYTNLASGVTGQTVTVTTNWGTTADTPAIATAKGWTVTGS